MADPRTGQLLMWAGLGLALTLGASAEARMGGGHSYGGGGSSGGGSYSGGGSSGGEAAIIELLFWLILEQPVIGIPLTIIVIGVWVYKNRSGSARPAGGAGFVQPRPPKRRRPAVDFDRLRQRDPNFSEPLFRDLIQLVFVRAHEARGGDFGHLRAYLAPPAMQTLQGLGGAKATDVVIGASKPASLSFPGDDVKIAVDFQANYTENGARIYCDERWIFQRAADARSPGPAKMRSLNCPSCGSPSQPDAAGRCAYCETPISDGKLQWRVVEIATRSRRPVRAPELTSGGGVEVGTQEPTVIHPDLQANFRALNTRHAGFRWKAFEDHVREVFLKLQGSWTTMKWETARPFLTDPVYQANRYWIEQYKQSGLRNRLEDIRVTEIVPARITLDAYFEAITVRIFAEMRDWTEDGGGKVVGGSKKKKRVFSEYWTFIRAVGAKESAPSTSNCPSCAAPLDHVNETGTCEYCGAVITGGDFGWVLSAIQQDEVYTG